MSYTTKTKKAPIKWDRNNMVTCTTNGVKELDGKVIWYDGNGNAYELIYARLTKSYSFNPCPKYNR